MSPKFRPQISDTEKATEMIGDTPSPVLVFRVSPRASTSIPTRYKSQRFTVFKSFSLLLKRGAKGPLRPGPAHSAFCISAFCILRSALTPSPSLS